MDQYKGIVKINVLGAERGFKFGTMQAALFCKEMKCKLSDMAVLLDGNDIDAQITWYWSASVAYSRLYKETEYSKDEVAAWIDTYGFESMDKQTAESMLVPNDQTPLNQKEGDQSNGQ
jgi:hypothetical protein